MRTCVGCRARRPKSEMLRFTAAGVDREGRPGAGRGLYVCLDRECIRSGLARADVRKRLSAGEGPRVLKALAAAAGAENHLDGPRMRRVISDQYFGGGPIA
jgi:predicted RNA-binding protein YlxR (DUF448 family)